MPTVENELKPADRLDIVSAIIAARISPRTPAGSVVYNEVRQNLIRLFQCRGEFRGAA